MPNSEILLRDKANLGLGWTKCNQPFIGRVIRIGHQKNCNDDNLIVNYHIKNEVESLFTKYQINDYILNEIKTQFEFSYEIKLKEDVYELFIDNLNQSSNINV